MVPGHVCPGCGGREVHRSTHMSWLVRVISRIFRGKRPYRCVECWTRFWDRRLPLTRAVPPAPGPTIRNGGKGVLLPPGPSAH
jgi:hypothetical protein